jgi:hypothetical protein
MFGAGSRPLRTHEGRSGIPRCSSGRMAKTVTVPPVTGVLIRARKVPETLPAKYSVVAFEGTGIVVKAVQVVPVPEKSFRKKKAVASQSPRADRPPIIP